MNTIGSRIRQLRKKLNMTQFDFAKALEIKQSSLSQIESNKIMPSIETLIKIKRVFNTSFDWLLEGVHPKTSVEKDTSSKDVLDKLIQTLITVKSQDFKSQNSFNEFKNYFDEKIDSRIKPLEILTQKLYKKLEGRIFEDELAEEIKISNKKLRDDEVV